MKISFLRGSFENFLRDERRKKYREEKEKEKREREQKNESKGLHTEEETRKEN